MVQCGIVPLYGKEKMRKYLKESRPQATGALLAGVLCLFVAAAQPAYAVEGARYVACPSCAPQDLAWGEGEFDQVHLAAAPADTRNLHPQSIAPETLGKALAALRAAGSQGTARLLDADAATNLAQGLSKALAKAGPQQDAVFMITSKPGGGLFGAKLGNSGRAFVDDNGLNLIFGEAHVEFVAPYRATRLERPFDFGSRSQVSKVVLNAADMPQPRKDWIVIIPLTAGRSIGAVQAVGTAAGDAAKATVVLRDEQFYAAQEVRLKGLKRLRDQNLISEEEFQSKRTEILKAW